MEPNNKFIELRKRLGPTQEEFAHKLGISRSTIADIERGAIGVSKRVKSKILDNFKNESGYFEEKKLDKNVEMKQGKEIGAKQGFGYKNRSYLYKFSDFIKNKYPQYKTLTKDMVDIFSISEITDELHDSKLGDAFFYSLDDFKGAKSYKDFKNKGLEVFNEAFKYREIVHEFANACRKFALSLEKIKEEIELNYDFEEWLS